MFCIVYVCFYFSRYFGFYDSLRETLLQYFPVTTLTFLWYDFPPKMALLLCLLWAIQNANGYHLVYLEGYPGNLKLIQLPDLTAAVPSMLDLNNAVDITPTALRDVCGNPDVSPDGTKIVFGAINQAADSWDIYMGDLNVEQGSIDNLQNVIATNLREEDPRFSYDGTSFVYKAGTSWTSPIWYDIWKYDLSNNQTTTLVQCSCDALCPDSCNHCELWGPAYHPCGDRISYTGRICEGGVNYDEIYVYDMETAVQTQITDNALPDMYSHWKRDGTLLFSRKDNGVDDLYLYDPGADTVSSYLSVTGSDDDAYAFKQDNDLFLFIGLADAVAGYELYVVRNETAYQLTAQSNMLGPVVFDSEIPVTVPPYCDASNSMSTTPSPVDGVSATTTSTADSSTTTSTESLSTSSVEVTDASSSESSPIQRMTWLVCHILVTFVSVSLVL